MRVDLRILDPRLSGWGFPHYGSAFSAGLDLHACIEAPLVLPPDSAAVLVSSGLAVHIADPDWCGFVAPRSGLGHKGLVLGNAVGIIDADYEGPVLVSAWNRNPPGGDAITINPGDRIAQLMLVRITRPDFRVVESFAASDGRGGGGFGSTGVSAGTPTRT